MHTLYFVIGASGSGKTAAVHELERTWRVRGFYFDSVGVPSERDRMEKWGGAGGWQRAMTLEWAARIHPELATAPAVLDAQTRPSFIAEACDLAGVRQFRIVLLTCSDDTRRARLRDRGQPELASDQMMQWAQYLVTETRKADGMIIENDKLSIAETASALAQIVAGSK